MKHLNPIILTLAILFSSCSGAKQAVQKNKQDSSKTIVQKLPEDKKEVIEEVEEVEKSVVIKTEDSINEVTEKKPKEEEETKEVIKEIEDVVEENTTPTELFNHATWNDLIYQNVAANGDVNYKGFKNNWSVLRNYIADLGKQLPEEGWSKEEKLAYWMNAYNAMTIDLILRNYPIASIKDIKNPWDQRLWKLGAKWYNLNEIEHQILRKMGDPRIHFGINCASFSCPPLLNEAFTSTKVDKQLDTLAVRFINDTERNIITPNSVKVSKIFSWFSKDFKQDGDLVSFLNKYSKTPISAKAKKSYVDYNWNLNEQ